MSFRSDRRVVARVVRVVDVLLAPLVLVGMLAVKLLRRAGLHRTPVARGIYDRLGVVPVPDHYYQPLVVPDRHLPRGRHEARELPGLDLRVEQQLALLAALTRTATEVEAFLGPAPDELTPTVRNAMYGPADADVLYGMVRHLAPTRVLEIGSGQSTRFVAAALRRNADEGSPAAWHRCIEPYENDWLEALGIEVIRRRVEDLPLETFAELSAGDVLFVDASHVIRPGGDVLRVFLEVLPSLRPGVVVHVHDIFTPRDYPDSWIFDERRLWNEQYLLEAVLSDSPRYRVLLALDHLAHEHPEQLAEACPSFDPRAPVRPGAFWFEVVGSD